MPSKISPQPSKDIQVFHYTLNVRAKNIHRSGKIRIEKAQDEPGQPILPDPPQKIQ